MKKVFIVFLLIVSIFSVSSQAVSESKLTETTQLRVVSLAPNVTEIIYALGAGDLLVGRTDYCNYPDEALAVRSIGTLWDPNLEVVLSLNADVAIASSIVDPEYIISIEKAGIEAYQFYEESNGIEGAFSLIKEVAEVIGYTEQADALIADMRARVEAVQQKVAGIEDKKSVVFIISYGDWGDYAATGDTYINDVIETAGGINAAKEGQFWSISRELLLSQDPDVVLMGSHPYTDIAGEINAFISLAPYSELTASKTGQVFMIDGDAADRQGVRTVDTLEEIARILYPELF